MQMRTIVEIDGKTPFSRTSTPLAQIGKWAGAHQASNKASNYAFIRLHPASNDAARGPYQ